MEDKIKRIAAKYVKLYRGKGPQYVKVNINYEFIQVYSKGILSTVGELLIKQGAFKLPEMAWNELRKEILDSFIDEVSKEIGKECSLVSERTDFYEDTRTIIIKLDS